jgi:hypothetical protein
VYVGRQYWTQFGGGRPQSELYGIWDVREMMIDNQAHPALLSDDGRWRRAIFDFPGLMTTQQMDDTFTFYSTAFNSADKTLVLGRRDDKGWKANLSYQRPARDRLILNGQIADHQVHLDLQLVDRNKFLLVHRGFHWIQESESALNR